MSSKTVEISPDGDVILVCGERFRDGQTKKLKVSSAVLSLGSSVMKAMFKPYFKEGIDLRSNGSKLPLEIVLPEDDPLGMEVICYVMHLRNDKIDFSRSFSAESTSRVAVTSDKYNCHIAMMCSAQQWLDRPTSDQGQLRLLLTAAYLFHNSEAFRDCGRRLVLHMSSSASAGATEYEKDHLQAMLDAIDWKRMNLNLRIQAAIEAVVEARSTLRTTSGIAHACLPGCGVAEICLTGFIQSLKESALYPLRAMIASSIHETILRLRTVAHVPPKGAFACASSDCIGRAFCLGSGTSKYLDYEATIVRSTLVGPCLTCFLEAGLVEFGSCEHFQPTPWSESVNTYKPLEMSGGTAPSPPTIPLPTSAST